MNASKFLVTTAAAVTVVGAIGFAYAQTAYDSGTNTSPQTQNPAAMPTQPVPADTSIAPDRAPSGSTGAMNQGATGTTSSGAALNDPGSRSNERVARADRN